MNEKIITISRGFTRKINLGNINKKWQYESIDFFANYSKEIPTTTSQEEISKISEALQNKAEIDVDSSADEYIYNLLRPEKSYTDPKERFKREFKSVKHDKIDKKAKSLNSVIEDIQGDADNDAA